MSNWWYLVSFGVFLIGLTKSGFGSGLGLLAVPIISVAMERIPGRGAQAGIGLMLPLLIAGDVFAAWPNRKVFSREAVARLLPGSVVGLVLGAVLLWAFHRAGNDKLVSAIISTEIGVESIFLVSLHWWRQWKGMPANTIREPLRGQLTGTFAATSSTLCHGAGPIIATYLLPYRMERKTFVGTCAIYFFVVNTLKLPGYYLAGEFERAGPTLAARFLPLVAVGALAGIWLNRRMSDKLFSKIVYVSTFLAGCYILFEGITGLLKSA